MTVKDQRRLSELESAITANDEYLQKLEKSHAELLAALKVWRNQSVRSSSYRTNILDQTDEAIANAEKLK